MELAVTAGVEDSGEDSVLPPGGFNRSSVAAARIVPWPP